MGTAGGVTNFAGLYGKRRGEISNWCTAWPTTCSRIDALGGLNSRRTAWAGASAYVRTTPRSTRSRPTARRLRASTALPRLGGGGF